MSMKKASLPGIGAMALLLVMAIAGLAISQVAPSITGMAAAGISDLVVNPSIILNSTSGNNWTTDNLTLYYSIEMPNAKAIINWMNKNESIAVVNMPFENDPYAGEKLKTQGFEGLIGSWNWTAASWVRVTDQKYTGSASARSGPSVSNSYLTSNTTNTSGVLAIYIDFWYRKSGIESSDFSIQYYTGSEYITGAYLDIGGDATDNQWLRYTEIITDSKYFIPNFSVRFRGLLGTSEYIWVDDFNMSVYTGAPDYSGRGNDGIPLNASFNSTGGYDMRGAYEFNGTNAYITIPNNESLNFTDKLTVEAWVKPYNEGYIAAKSYSNDPVTQFLDYFDDDETGPINVTLHTPEIGSGWEQGYSAGGLYGKTQSWALSHNYYPNHTTSSGTISITSDEIATENYNVSASIILADSSTGDTASLVARWQDDNNFYVFTFDRYTTTIHKRVSGVCTLLYQNSSVTISSGTLTLKVDGETITAYLGGSIIANATDSSLSLPGKAGIGFGKNPCRNGDADDWTLSNFKVIYIPQAPSTPFALTADNGGEFAIFDSGEKHSAAAGGSIADGNWHHLVGTYDGSETRLYVDGELKGSSSTYSGNLPPSEFDIWVGRHYENNNITGYFNGTIDELRIYNRTLSPEQINALYQNMTNLTVSQQTKVGDIWQACITLNNGTDEIFANCSNALSLLSRYPIKINSAYAPSPQGYGRAIIRANITDGDGDEDIYGTIVEITLPNSTKKNYTLSPAGTDIWESDALLFANGTYGYTVYAVETNGSTDTESGSLDIEAYISSNIRTGKDVYTNLVNATSGAYVSTDMISLKNFSDIVNFSYKITVAFNYTGEAYNFSNADIVWVIDASGSMGDDQQRISDNAHLFAQKMDEKNIDYRLGVVAYLGIGDNWGGHPYMSTSNSWPITTAGSPSTPLIGTGSWTTSAPVFGNMVVAVPERGWIENGLAALNETLRHYTFRENAKKFFIIITDEDDDLYDGDMGSYGDAYLNSIIQEMQDNEVTVYAIAPPLELIYPEYIGDNGVAKKTGGKTFSLYDDFSGIISELGELISAEATLSTTHINSTYEFASWTNQTNLTVKEIVQSNPNIPADFYTSPDFKISEYKIKVTEATDAEGRSQADFVETKFAHSADGPAINGTNTSYVENASVYMFFPKLSQASYFKEHLGLNSSGYLLMKLQRWNGTDYTDNRTIMNSTYYTVNASRYSWLDRIWNPNSISTENMAEGSYRAYAAMLDESGNVLADSNGTPMNATHEFQIDDRYVATEICGITVANDTVLGGSYGFSNSTQSGACVSITASNITLDCNGNYLVGQAGPGYQTGILAAGVSNVTIKNCIIYDFDYGLRVYSSSHLNITNNRMEDNSIDFGVGERAISSWFGFDNKYENLDHYIDTSNKVSWGKSVYYLKNAANTVYDSSDIGTLYCINCTNITVQNLDITNEGIGIYLWSPTNSSIKNSRITNSSYSIIAYNSYNTNITGNTITDSGEGIDVYFGQHMDNLNEISNNTISGVDFWGIGIIGNSSGNVVNISNQKVKNNKISYVWRGIEVSYVNDFKNSEISGNIISNLGIGVYNSFGYVANPWFETNVSILNNTITGSTYSGMFDGGELRGCIIANNTIANNSKYGIQLSEINNTVISGNTITGNEFGGLYMGYQAYNTILTGNDITNNWHEGIIFNDYLTNVTVSGNSITGNDDGIVFGTYNIEEIINVTISSNNISNNLLSGIAVRMSTYYLPESAVISGNTIEGNNEGILFEANPRGFNITGNQISGNFLGGIYVLEQNHVDNFTISNNTIKENYIFGIVLNGTGNRVYNNYFDNLINAIITGSNNEFNTTLDCISGPNAIGGSCLGGNYWSDYSGLDDGSGGRAEGDGIGDTGIPYIVSTLDASHGDYLPLVFSNALSIWDETDSMGGSLTKYPGDSVAFWADYTYQRESLENASCAIIFGDNSSNITEMEPGAPLPAGTAWAKERVSHNSTYIDLCLDSSELPHVTYDSPGNITYSRKTLSGIWATENASQFDPGEMSVTTTISLALDSEDLPHIAYVLYNATGDNFSLWHAHYNGTVWNTAMLDIKPGTYGLWSPSVDVYNDAPAIAVCEPSDEYGGEGILLYIYNKTSEAWEKNHLQTYCEADDNTLELKFNSSGTPMIAYEYSENPYGWASFHISQMAESGEWEEKYVQPFDVEYTTKQFMLNATGKEIRAMVVQRNKSFAGIEQIRLEACGQEISPEYAAYSENNESVLYEVSSIDRNVIDAHEKEVEVSWQMPEECDEPATLYLTANEYSKNAGVPLRFPVNGFKKYRMGSSRGTINADGFIEEVDGTSPLYSPFWTTTTGHPPGYAYIYVQDDNSNAYVSLDITPDNTNDFGSDWAELTVLTKEGKTEVFRIDDMNDQWGRCGFAPTSKAGYRHQTCEFSIPKDIIGQDDFEFRLRYYGTAGTVYKGIYFATMNSSGSWQDNYIIEESDSNDFFGVSLSLDQEGSPRVSCSMHYSEEYGETIDSPIYASYDGQWDYTVLQKHVKTKDTAIGVNSSGGYALLYEYEVDSTTYISLRQGSSIGNIEPIGNPVTNSVSMHFDSAGNIHAAYMNESGTATYARSYAQYSGHYYTYSRTFDAAGIYDWNVTCNKTGYANATATDTVTITAVAAPPAPPSPGGPTTPTCTDTCTTTGEKRCSGNNLQTCERGSDGCRSWVSQACGDRKTCDPSTLTCIDCVRCSPTGEARCSGNILETCRIQGDGCQDWTTTLNCGTGFTCNSETLSCVECNTCPAPGRTRCSGNRVEECSYSGGSCLIWKTRETCDDDETCRNSACVSAGAAVEVPTEVAAPPAGGGCTEVLQKTSTTTLSTREVPISEIQIPAGYEIVKQPFQIDCRGDSFYLTLNIPSEYTDVTALRCAGGTCMVETETTSTTTFSCGVAIAEEVAEEERFLAPQQMVPIISQEKALSEIDRAISSGNNRIEFLPPVPADILVSIKSPEIPVHEPNNPELMIVGTPLVAKISTSSGRLGATITMPYTAEGIEENSAAIYIAQNRGTEWITVESTINREQKTISARIDNIIGYLENSEIILAVIAVKCEYCQASQLEKAYSYPGSRDAIILIHGMGSNPDTFTEMIQEFEYNQQPWQIWTFGYSPSKEIDTAAEELANLLESHSLEYDNIYLVAHSLGGLITQAALQKSHQETNRYTYVGKIRKAIMIAVPNEGSPGAELYQNLYKYLVNFKGKGGIFDVNSNVIDEVVRGRITPRVPGVDYYVIAGTKPYEFNLGLFKAGAEALGIEETNDGLVTTKSAQHIGDNYVSNMCKDYWEIHATHTEIIDAQPSVKVIQKILSDSIAEKYAGMDLLGRNQYFKLRVDECSPTDTYILIGKKVRQESILDELCGCGNGFCGQGEDALNCPADCARMITAEKVFVSGPILIYALTILNYLLILRYSIKKHLLGRKSGRFLPFATWAIAAGSTAVYRANFGVDLYLAYGALSLSAAYMIFMNRIMQHFGMMPKQLPAEVPPAAAPEMPKPASAEAKPAITHEKAAQMEMLRRQEQDIKKKIASEKERIALMERMGSGRISTYDSSRAIFGKTKAQRYDELLRKREQYLKDRVAREKALIRSMISSREAAKPQIIPKKEQAKPSAGWKPKPSAPNLEEIRQNARAAIERRRMMEQASLERQNMSWLDRAKARQKAFMEKLQKNRERKRINREIMNLREKVDRIEEGIRKIEEIKRKK